MTWLLVFLAVILSVSGVAQVVAVVADHRERRAMWRAIRALQRRVGGTS